MHVSFNYIPSFSYESRISCINLRQVSSDADAAPTQWLTEVVDESITVFLEDKGTISNSEAEVERLKKKREETRK